MTETVEQESQISIGLAELMSVMDRVTQGPEVYHTVKSACQKMDIGRSTFERWRKDGRLPEPVEVNGVQRYRDSDLEKMIAYQNPHLLGVKENKVMADAMAVVANL